MRPTRALLSRNWANKNPQRPQAAKIHPRSRQSRRCLGDGKPETREAHEALSAWLPRKASKLPQSPYREGFGGTKDTCRLYPGEPRGGRRRAARGTVVRTPFLPHCAQTGLLVLTRMASRSSSLAAGRLGRLPRGPVPTRPLPSLGPGAGSSQRRG